MCGCKAIRKVVSHVNAVFAGPLGAVGEKRPDRLDAARRLKDRRGTKAMPPHPVLLFMLLVGATWTSLASADIPAGRIAYIVGAGGSGELFILDLSTGMSNQVPLPVSIGDVSMPNWSSDGELLAFNTGGAGADKIYTVRPDGSDLFYVTHSPWGGEPSFSPDSSEIVFHAIAGGWRLHTVNADGTNRTNLGVAGVHARWSPVEDKIAYSNWATIPLPYQSDIFVYDRGTGLSTQITNHAPNHGFARVAWSPDGSILAVNEIDHGTGDVDLWVMHSDGSNPINLTSDWDTSNEDLPSWSSDGQFIVFSSNRSGNQDIWAMHPDGSGKVNLTNTPEDEFVPWIGPPAPGCALPPPPAQVTAEGSGAGGSVDVSWQANAPADNVTGYRISFGQQSGSLDGEHLVDANVTGFQVTGLQNYVEHFFTVTAINDCGEGDPSGEVGATPTQPSGDYLKALKEVAKAVKHLVHARDLGIDYTACIELAVDEAQCGAENFITYQEAQYGSGHEDIIKAWEAYNKGVEERAAGRLSKAIKQFRLGWAHADHAE